MKARQKGMALVLSMVIVVIAILLGLSGVSAALFEERMTGNYRFSISALQASEAGVKDIISYVRTTYSPSSPPDCSSDGQLYASPSKVVYSTEGGLSRDYEVSVECESGDVVGYSLGRVYQGSDALSERKVRIVVIPPGENEIEGMLADGDITLNGNSSIVGNVHANSNVDIKQLTDSTIGYITASGQVTTNDKDVEYSGSDGCDTVICASSGVETMSVPSASEAIVDEMNSLGFSGSTLAEVNASATDESATTSADGYEILPVSDGECSLDLSGSQLYDDGGEPEQKRFYCPGALTLSGSFSGAYIMASGDIEHNGNSNLGDPDADGTGEVDTYIVSGGTITLNGSDDSYAALHADGDIIQNGESKLYGSLVSGGSITRNGGIDFEAMKSGFIMVPVSGFIDEWYEMEDPSA
ncbi:pilus assembly PilX N-terminal domain-containing protein [Halomonas organivorans]